jgi:hypothetical protein
VDIGADIIAALSGGGAAVARMEIARLVSSAVTRLSSRGRMARELARVADVAARSDADLAQEMDRLTPAEQTSAAAQLDEALVYDEDDPDERAATAALVSQAEQVRQLLVNHGLIAGTNSGVAVTTNTGQIISQSGSGTVHAPFHVGGDYHAGPAQS